MSVTDKTPLINPETQQSEESQKSNYFNSLLFGAITGYACGWIINLGRAWYFITHSPTYQFQDFTFNCATINGKGISTINIPLGSPAFAKVGIEGLANFFASKNVTHCDVLKILT